MTDYHFFHSEAVGSRPEAEVRHLTLRMQRSPALVELDSLLSRSDLDSSGWSEYEHEDGSRLLASLNSTDHQTLMREAKAKPANWRGCLISILRPERRAEGELMIQALDDFDEEVAYEALHRIYFFSGFSSSTKKGTYEDVRHRVHDFWSRICMDQTAMARIEELSKASEYLSAYWVLLSTAAAASLRSVSMPDQE